MPLRALAYASKALPALPQSKIASITEDASMFNMLGGVTGVLLYDGTWFFQYIEGPADGVAIAYDRILGSSSHTNIKELARGRIEQRLFPYWSMRQLSIDSERVGRLMLAEWLDFARGGKHAEGTGVDQLSAIVRPYVVAA